MTVSVIGTLKLSPSPMILFSTFPHQRTTPLLPAGTITKVLQKMMKSMMSTTMIPRFRGLGPLNPYDSSDFSCITHLLLDVFPFGEMTPEPAQGENRKFRLI